MIVSPEGDTNMWLASLPQLQLHALAHELGRRLVETSQVYQARKTDLEQRTTNVDNIFFGLGEHATERDLENAYRRLARQMHPDKNGGTEEAKQQFWVLVDRSAPAVVGWEDMVAAWKLGAGEVPNPYDNYGSCAAA